MTQRSGGAGIPVICIILLMSCGQLMPAAGEATAVRVGYGGMAVVGPPQAALSALEQAVLTRIDQLDTVQLIAAPELHNVLSRQRTHAFTWASGAASSLGQTHQLAALLYLTAVTAPEIVGATGPWIKAVVVHTARDAEMYYPPLILPTRPVPLKEGIDKVAPELAGRILSRLPVLGHVAAVIQSGEQVRLQVYVRDPARAACKVGGEYALYSPDGAPPLSVTLGEQEPRAVAVTVPARELGTLRINEMDADGMATASVNGLLNVPPLGTLVLVGAAGDFPYCDGETSVVVLSEPPDVRCDIAGNPVGVTPLLLSGKAAEGELLLRSEAWRELTANLSKSAGRLSFWQGQMQKIPPFGTLEISSKPEAAQVSVDGKIRGNTPLRLEHFPAGTHRVEIELKHFSTFTDDVEVKPEELAKVETLLLRNAQQLNVTSEPAGAGVFIDGEQIGKTPLEAVSVPVGKHTLTAKLEGFAEAQQEIEIVATAAPEPLHLTLQQLPGALALNSDPAAAEVHLDGNKLGLTPLRVDNLAPGEHRLELRKSGYENRLETVTVASAKTTEKRIVLRRETGSLVVNTVPVGAQLTVDGRLIGPTPIRDHRLTVGAHTVALSLPGHRKWTTEVEIAADKAVEIAVAMIELPTKPPERQPIALPEPTDEFVQVADLEVQQTGSAEPAQLRVLVAGTATAQNCICRVELSCGFPEATQILQAHRMSGVIIPKLEITGPVQKFEVNKGSLTTVQIGQLSRKGQTVRVELDLLNNPAISHSYADEKTLEFRIDYRETPRTQATDKRIALTFDDFPFARSGYLLDFLDEQGISATMFVIGGKVAHYPQFVRRAAVAGHRLENHYYDGQSFTELTDEVVADGIRRTNEEIMRITGAKPRLLRAPGGNCQQNHRQILRQEGLAYCGWTSNPGDYKLRDADKIAAHILHDAKPNGVILLHDNVPETVQALRKVVPILRARGYSFVTVQQLMNPDVIVQK